MSAVRLWWGPPALLLIDRPTTRNALNLADMAELDRVVAALTTHPPPALVITGGGGRFIAGGDLKALASKTSAQDGHALATTMQATLAALAALPCPVIAAVERDALGGGVELLLACDRVIAASDARIALRQVQLGLTTAWGGARRLAQRVGRARALDLLWTGRDLSGAEALAIGLVDELVAPGEALEAALAFARRVSAHSPAVIAGFKRLLDDPAASEAEIFAEAWAAPPHQEAVARWLSRTPPSNHGNQMEKPTTSRGRFLVLEGIDGAGTTTQTRLLTRWLQRSGRRALQTGEPSTGPLGTLIRQALRGRLVGGDGRRLDPRAIAGLFVADRADHLQNEIEPALAAGIDVICDRYVLSSLAYQGSECDPAWIRALNAVFPAPDLTLFVDVSAEIAAVRRARRGGQPDFFEVDDFQRQVAAAYRAAATGVEVVTIDGSASVREVFRACRSAIEK